jgi:predicted permease
MKLLAYLRSIVAKLFRRSQMDAEMEDELRAHIQNRADDLERSGLARVEAERRARIEFGGYQRFKEESREAARGTFMESFLQDVRFSFRVLRKSPGFSLVAVATLALAIGANAVVFSILNGLILRPLNVPRAESLYAVERGKDAGTYESYLNYLDLRDRNRSFDDLIAFDVTQAGLDSGENANRAWVYEVSGNYFDALGIQPFLGRFFHSSDEHGPNSAPFIVLSHAYWHVNFQDDRGVVGRIVLVNKHPFTVIGVAPPEFHGTVVIFTPDFYVPLVNVEQVDGKTILGVDVLNARGSRWVAMLMGHLKPGVTPAQAVADLDSIGAYLEKTYPKDDGQMIFRLARPSLSGDLLGGPVRGFVTALMVLAGLILLAACANLGSLFAARSADRSREVALRLALGASRTRILRQLLTEAVLLSLIGGTFGIWGSVALLRGLSAWQPISRVPIHIPVEADANVYIVALVLSLVSGFLFGIVPVRQVLKANPYEIVKGAPGLRVGRRISVRDFLLAGQIAICAVLVTSSMVAVRGLTRSLHSDFGFQPENAMLANTNLGMAGYNGEAVLTMQRRMIDALNGIPGVTSAAVVSYPPLTMGGITTGVFTDQTTDLTPRNAAAQPYMIDMSPDYFQAAGTALLAGRTFSWHDNNDAPHVAVVNREFANKLFGSVTKAVGGYFKRRDGTRIQVVGIVEDGKYFNLTEDQQPAMFLPILQSPIGTETWLVVRSSREPQQLAADVRGVLRGLDSGLVLYLNTWSKELSGALFAPRMATISLGVLGVMGAMLSVTGIFGMAAYAVSKRKKELGIRMALGAQRKEILQAALGRAFKLLAFGSAAGLLLGILASRVLASIVYSATPRDPLVLAGVVIAMMFVGLLATWIPAQRALSIDPITLLREE